MIQESKSVLQMRNASLNGAILIL